MRRPSPPGQAPGEGPATPPPTATRKARGATAHRLGLDAEALAEAALLADGWAILARRLRTPAGEIDLVADRAGLLAFVEVKARPSLSDAAFALAPRQQARLLAAAEAVLATNPGWGQAGIRFDVMLVDRTGRVRRIVDAFRLG